MAGKSNSADRLATLAAEIQQGQTSIREASQAARDEAEADRQFDAAWQHFIGICWHRIPEGTTPATFYREAGTSIVELGRLLRERDWGPRLGAYVAEYEDLVDRAEPPEKITANQRLTVALILQEALKARAKAADIGNLFHRTAETAGARWGLPEECENVWHNLRERLPDGSFPTPAAEVEPEPEEMPADVPVSPDGFCFQGVVYHGFTSKPWRMVDYLWTCRGMKARFESLGGPVSGDHSEPMGNDQVGSYRREANRIFEYHKIPYRVRVQRHTVMLERRPTG